jgi:hypothetical protein
VEWWSSGVVEWWSGGVVEWWSSGVMEWWTGGVRQVAYQEPVFLRTDWLEGRQISSCNPPAGALRAETVPECSWMAR